MAEKFQKYILMSDRVGEHTEKGWITTKNVPTQLLRGEIFEALPESDQPEDPDKIALKVIYTSGANIKLECPTLDVVKLSDSEADLLAAVSSLEERFRIFRERNRLAPGKALDVGATVLVKLKNNVKEYKGVIWYKGTLPTHKGIMFGVELLDKEAEGQGTSDGTFRNKKYFECPQDRGVFVALDKLRPHQDTAKSPKKEPGITSKIKDLFIPSVSSKDSNSHNKLVAQDHQLKIDQRVVIYTHDNQPLRGTVRYISEKCDSNGDRPIGIELDKRMGKGTGMFQGKQRFVCKRDHAVFYPVSTVIPEEHFDASNSATVRSSYDRLAKSDGFSGSLGYDVNFRKPGKEEIKRSNSVTSISSQFNEEALVGQNPVISETLVKEQKRILNDIKARQKPKVENEIDGVTETVAVKKDADEAMPFDDEHFNKSPKSNSEPLVPHTTGHSKVYLSNDEEKAHQEDGLREKGHKSSRPEDQNRSTSLQIPSSILDSDNQYINNIPTNPHVIKNKPAANMERIPVQAQFDVGRSTLTSSSGLVQPSVSGEIKTPTDMEMRDPQSSVQVSANDNVKSGGSGLEVGSMVEVRIIEGKANQYGVIRWIGHLPELAGKTVAGLELEVEQAACSDGVFGGQRYFTCPPGRGFFVNLQNCHRDSRFQGESPGAAKYSGKAFGRFQTPWLKGTIPPPTSLSKSNQGRMKGIQGHHNSCYLDATLFSMFAFTTVFDSLLHRSKDGEDLEQYETVQEVLKEYIVNPLRDKGFVSADRVMNLRCLLDELGSTSGLMNEEKDPEEFLNSLLHQVLKSEPLLKLKTPNNRGEETNYYQIITEKDDTKKIQTVQKLLEQSFFFSDLKLAEVPSCLILQMPRFGKRYKMYDFILPTLKLDITHILENVPRDCSVCGLVSSYECKECYHDKGGFLAKISYCKDCNERFHQHPQRQGHNPKPIAVPREYSHYSKEQGNLPIDKQTMDLFAVVCIATSHYVAFVKCGTSDDSQWCFFDSMADREGETNGYNIPVVTPCPEAKEWLSKNDDDIVRASENGQLPPSMKRLFGDAYMCLYQNLEMTMYK